ncbi:putative lipoprotein with Yx(FWY)xxD motif [Rhodanobacter sp. TND4EL1]
MIAFRCAAALLLLAGTASASSLPRRNAQGLLADRAGHTLYRYDPDGRSGISHCSGACAAVWPPLLADPAAGPDPGTGYSLTRRADGSRQWVYRGQPLYLFAGDGTPGDSDGDGVNGSWHVLR